MTEYYVPIRNQPYIDMYSFEEIDLPFWRNWFGQNWIISVYIGIAYVSFIFLGQNYMKNREPYDLRKALALWNFGMAFFSAYAFIRVFPELLFLLRQTDGLYQAACKMVKSQVEKLNQDYPYLILYKLWGVPTFDRAPRDNHGMTMAFWALTYTLSKTLQLGDTVFIVLRKKKLILLHWYHHAAVMMLSWYAYQPYIPLLRFVGNMNYFTHSWMYSYYGLRALEIKLPKKISLLITVLELIQMVAGLLVTLFTIYQYNGERGCLISARAIATSCAIYSTLFVLFAKHFQTTAFKKRKTV